MKAWMMALALAIPAWTAVAQYSGPNAENMTQPITVKQLLASGRDDQHVMLRGHITKRIGNERYQFSDGTGEILAKIKPKHWPHGQAVDDKTMVELTGEYDKELIGPSKLEVKHIKLLQ